jgi:hypothetical protein
MRTSQHSSSTREVSSSNSSLIRRTARAEQWNRQALFLISCLYIFLFIGAFYGYGQLQLILEDNQAFAFLCPDSEEDTTNKSNSVCSAQTNALIRVQLIAQSVQMAAPLLGYGVDRCGARRAYIVLTAHILSGLLILLVCTSLSHFRTGSVPQVDRFLYVAMVLLSIGVCLAAILIVQTGLFFHGRVQRRVIFILNALFDAGAISYLFLWLFYTKTNASITTVFATYFGISLLTFGTGMYFWCVAVPETIDTTVDSENANQIKQNPCTENNDLSTGDDTIDDIVQDSKETSTNGTNHTSSTVVIVDSNDEEEASPIVDPTAPTKNRNVLECEADGCTEADLANGRVQVDPTTSMTNPPNRKKLYVLIAHRTRMQQLTSTPAWCLAVFVGVHATSNNWTMATIRDFLASLGDDNYDNRYLTLFTLLTPVSLFGLPFVDYIMHHYGFHCAFQSVNALGLGYMLIRLCSSNLNVQVLGFIIFAFFRCFLYSVFQSFVPTLFSPDVVGLCIGLLVGIPGVAAFLNVPLAKYIIKSADGDFYVANLMYTLLIIPCVVAAYCIGQTIRREHLCKEELRRLSQDQPNVQSKSISPEDER